MADLPVFGQDELRRVKVETVHTSLKHIVLEVTHAMSSKDRLATPKVEDGVFSGLGGFGGIQARNTESGEEPVWLLGGLASNASEEHAKSVSYDVMGIEAVNLVIAARLGPIGPMDISESWRVMSRNEHFGIYNIMKAIELMISEGTSYKYP